MTDEKLPVGSALRSVRMRDLEGQLGMILSLRRERSAKSIQTLLEFLCDESWFLREKATEALMEVGAGVIPELMALTRNGLWFTRACAARILGSVGSSEHIPGLVGLFEDRNSTVRSHASQAILELARPDDGESLVNALAGSRSCIREAVLEGIRRLNGGFCEKMTRMVEARTAGRSGDESVRETAESDVIDIQDIISRPKGAL